MASAAQWLEGARPRTLPAAVAPVLVGSGAAAALDDFRLGRALLALGVSLALQVGVNYANDYSDGIRGTDADRVGPLRLTGSGAARPGQVKAAAFAAFGAGRRARPGPGGAERPLVAARRRGGLRRRGLVLHRRLETRTATWVSASSSSSSSSGWSPCSARRTPRPAGSPGRRSPAPCAVGALACAILVANNLRDIPTDATTGKRTLAVRIGDRASRGLYVGLLGAAFVLAIAAAPGPAGRPAGPARAACSPCGRCGWCGPAPPAAS